MTSFDGDKQVDSNTLWGFVKGVGAENKSLIAFADPASVKGRKMLMDGNIVYLLFPKTTNPIRLSPLQVLMGQASNGDVVRTGFSQDYDVASLTETDARGSALLPLLPDRQGKPQGRDVQEGPALGGEGQPAPRRTRSSPAGDKLLKQATYSDYRKALDKDIPFVVDIHDGENPQKHTVMTYVKVGPKTVAGNRLPPRLSAVLDAGAAQMRRMLWPALSCRSLALPRALWAWDAQASAGRRAHGGARAAPVPSSPWMQSETTEVTAQAALSHTQTAC